MKNEIVLSISVQDCEDTAKLTVYDLRKRDQYHLPKAIIVASSDYDYENRNTVVDIEANDYWAPYGTISIPGTRHREALTMIAHTIAVNMKVREGVDVVLQLDHVASF